MTTPARKPRPADVARWVAVLAAPLPSMRDGAAYAKALHAHTRAGNGLMAAGLDNAGNPVNAAEVSL